MSDITTNEVKPGYDGMTVGEWADAMVARLQELPVYQSVYFMANMTQEQRDIIRARLQQGESK